jgi:hypothetical protein
MNKASARLDQPGADPRRALRGTVRDLPPGSLRSPVGNFNDGLRKKLTEKGITPHVAAAVGNAIGRAWAAWAAGWETRIPTALPPFAAYPLPAAVPHPTLPHPLRLGVSSAEGGLNLVPLLNAIKAEIGPSAQEHNADSALSQFVTAFSARFHNWNSTALLVNVFGGGPSKFAPLPGPIFGTVVGDRVLAGPLPF